MHLLFFYLQIYSDEDTTDTEPSAEKEREQEQYSNVYDDSTDQEYDNRTQDIIDSREADGKLDCTEYPKISSVLAKQNAEVDVKGLDDLKYKAGDFVQYPDNKLECTEYRNIQTEQNTEADTENVNETECEADIENVNDTEFEADIENLNETECEADNLRQQFDLQNTQVQKGTYDMQIQGYVKRSEPSMELRSGRAVKKVTLVCTHITN